MQSTGKWGIIVAHGHSPPQRMEPPVLCRLSLAHLHLSHLHAKTVGRSADSDKKRPFPRAERGRRSLTAVIINPVSKTGDPRRLDILSSVRRDKDWKDERKGRDEDIESKNKGEESSSRALAAHRRRRLPVTTHSVQNLSSDARITKAHFAGVPS
ncbi:hypothetical protein EVAR_40443_1 [Eumeta japonica]|uniref:Uncharacterized protein n=1 Tax=Eumeta variegata TaxID=151549 RepID=A0A4C1X0I0_EUMVA|nr:hypothetical protein EVAR_40443_1 [Eumeta japonica]